MTTYNHQDHEAPLARSHSFFGAIKNIVTAPFAWFAGSEDEFEDTKGKRRRLPTISEDAVMEDETTPSRTKRIRVSSPDRVTQPYLDPPRSAFTLPRRTSDHTTSDAIRNVTRSPRKTLHLSSTSNQLRRSRRTLSPLPSGSHLKPQGVTRTMSLDPPSHSSLSSRIQPAPTIQDLPSETKHPKDSKVASRDVSMSPRHLRVRSSLTPQPSGTGFGPVVPPRRERGADEPPPLTALMSNPMFVKPPPAAHKQAAVDSPKQLTLGTLIDSKRSARTLARQSSILFGTGSMTDVSARHLWPVNKAEIALHELEVYKTPLLPTRLKGAAAVPDMFLQKERKPITLMTDDRPVKPRLGTKSEGKEKGKKKEREREIVNGTKPYAGEGGMKKWLARRKREEEEAKEKEQAEAMEDERADEERKRKEAEAEKKRQEEFKVPPSPPPAPAFEPRVSREGPLGSSLRVGRTRISRNHIERPVSRRTKFSAAFEDEDEDMEESRAIEQRALEEAAKRAPVFNLPAGFTFAKETSITHDLTHAKEPPIASLPFSLTKPAPTPTPALSPPAEKAGQITVSPPALPTISLVPPTPETTRVASPAPAPLPIVVSACNAASTSSVPNFFANSSVFAKSAIATTLPSSSLTVPVVEQLKPAEVPIPPAQKAADATPSLFGAQPISPFATAKPGSAATPPLFTAPTQLASAFATAKPNSAAAPSLFGAPTQPVSTFATAKSDSTSTPSTSGAPTLLKECEKSTPFTFGTPAKPAESVPAPTPSLASEPSPPAEPVKSAAPSGATPFAFGAPPSASTPALATPATVDEPKNVFTFGQPALPSTSTSTSAPAIAPPSTDTSKSLFGTPPSATPFSFGQRPSTAPAEGKPATTSFSFGTPAAEKKPTTGFTFGPPAASTAASASPAAFTFGGAPSGTTAADVSTKSFMFGSTAPARPVTPPKVVQEVTMDESPARDMALNGNDKAPERPTLNFSFNTPSGSALFAQSPATSTAPFSFGAQGATVDLFSKEKKETKPAATFGGFGQAPSTGFSFGQKPPESPATTTPAPAPFQFAQPSPSVVPPSPFTFGAAPTSAGAFGQPSTASAPSSPSTFKSFAFGPPSTTQPAASPFAFAAGSQPASPATGNTTLPSGTAGNAPFTFGAGTNAAPPGVSFGAAVPAAAPAGGSLFTMGSAPPPMEGVGGRRIKSLPRRGGRPR